MTVDLMCIGMHACVNGWLTVGTQADSCEYALHHGACDCCGIHAICAGYWHVKQQSINVKIIARKYAIGMNCIDLVWHTVWNICTS